ncbi:MAG: hypothetical protein M3M96_06195 [Candidatus Eremiobacteraeota bacterium]|nr:hypothetical protein [Candidatus Eremiobacteraeota bacterium]
MDLQLAYLAAPQNAAQVNVAQNAPLAARQAAQAAFIDELHKREETVEETKAAQGSVIKTNPDGKGNGEGYTPQERRQKSQYDADDSAPGLSGDGEHFIDVSV